MKDQIELDTNSETEKDMVALSRPSPLVKLLGQPGIEGYEEELYTPLKGKGKSGVTVGNGVDFGGRNEKSLFAMGVPKYLVKKVQDMKIMGLRGQAAEDQVQKLNKLGVGFTSSEVAFLSNQATRETAVEVANNMGQNKWDALSESMQFAAISLNHVYGATKLRKYNAWTQLKNNDAAGLQKNLSNFGDKNEGVNNRHRLVGAML